MGLASSDVLMAKVSLGKMLPALQVAKRNCLTYAQASGHCAQTCWLV